VEYARKVGITYKGFRPPGGTITSDTLCLMQKHGMKYISPVAKHAALLQSLVVLPLSWDMTDAYYYFEPLKHMRQKYGHGEDLLSPAVLKERMLATIDKLVEQGEYISLLFHPFLTNTPERRAVMEEIIEYVSKESRIWSAPCAEVADWILAHPEDFRRESGIQNSGWI
jgi:peptidoglycan/xylan/chitin deacetylase (PgdA/CDA1 family)